jgi:pimeloyl-ACP methyl ester carboxylesterase
VIRLASALAAAAILLGGARPARADVWDAVTHGTVDNGGVKIHYATLGKGPLVVMVHGFPDFWYSWRDQMASLSDRYQVVAIDQRGYNLSDRPAGQDKYDLSLLVSDLRAVVQHFTAKRGVGVPAQRDRGAGAPGASNDPAVIVGHDWGGMVAWRFAMEHPQLTDRLIILNLPHPRGLARELATNPQQQENAAYARRFQEPDAAKTLTAEGLAKRIADPAIRQRYIEAFKRSDFEAMLNYYKQNYPRPPYREDPSPVVKVTMPVLLFHGLNDTALLASALSRTWEWVDNTLTIVTVPGAGHWVQSDAAELVSSTMKAWLALPLK